FFNDLLFYSLKTVFGQEWHNIFDLQKPPLIYLERKYRLSFPVALRVSKPTICCVSSQGVRRKTQKYEE
ncbi:MAG: hypothetical protein QME06_04255, partial [Desulfobacterales bacterium]|nr:hypothetical protein [Desulfobacterales bacterium]